MLLPLVGKQNLKYYIFGVLLSIFALGIFSGIDSGILFKASTLNSIEHAPFDGTVYPYTQSVDWVNMSSAEREMTFDQIPDSKKISPVAYNAANLSREFASLGFDSEDKNIRNQKVTYSVPYMGNYKLDGKEYAGSHPAVDIVMPKETPVIAIANGVVTQVKRQSVGFGNHLVIMHRGVPDGSGGTTTVYSSYSHLGSIDVDEFAVVRKGDIIGYSGNSGNASVPHTHFQIDKESAPWYPYWPFSPAEQKAAGYDFVGAVNNGLNMENGIKYTINPMTFVQDNLSVSRSAAPEPKVEETKAEDTTDALVEDTVDKKEEESSIAESEVKPTENEATNNVETVTVKQELSDRLPKVQVAAPRKMLVGEKYEIKVKVYNLDSEFASAASGNYKFKPSLLGQYSLPTELDFNDEIVFPFEPKETGDLDLVIEIGGITAKVKNIEVKLFSDLSINDSDLKAISYLKNKGIISGYLDHTFKPSNTLTRAEAVKILSTILPGDYADLGDAKCKDVPVDAWYGTYFEKAYDIGAVAPNTNGECRPLDEINGYEYLKMLMTKVDVDPDVDDVYSEYFDTNSWFAPYLQEAMERNIITSREAVDYAKPLTRREVAELTYRFLQVAESKYEVFS